MQELDRVLANRGRSKSSSLLHRLRMHGCKRENSAARTSALPVSATGVGWLSWRPSRRLPLNVKMWRSGSSAEPASACYLVTVAQLSLLSHSVTPRPFALPAVWKNVPADRLSAWKMELLIGTSSICGSFEVEVTVVVSTYKFSFLRLTVTL